MSMHGEDRMVLMPALGRLLSTAVALLLLSDGASRMLATIPPTSIVGAILWTGYLGNFVVTHLPIV